MKIQQLIKRLENAERDIKTSGGDPEASEVMVTVIDDNGDREYTGQFTIFIDSRNDVSLEAISDNDDDE